MFSLGLLLTIISAFLDTQMHKFQKVNQLQKDYFDWESQESYTKKGSDGSHESKIYNT